MIKFFNSKNLFNFNELFQIMKNFGDLFFISITRRLEFFGNSVFKIDFFPISICCEVDYSKPLKLILYAFVSFKKEKKTQNTQFFDRKI